MKNEEPVVDYPDINYKDYIYNPYVFDKYRMITDKSKRETLREFEVEYTKEFIKKMIDDTTKED